MTDIAGLTQWTQTATSRRTASKPVLLNAQEACRCISGERLRCTPLSSRPRNQHASYMPRVLHNPGLLHKLEIWCDEVLEIGCKRTMTNTEYCAFDCLNRVACLICWVSPSLSKRPHFFLHRVLRALLISFLHYNPTGAAPKEGWVCEVSF
jgi:hypothetical protein